MSDEGNDESANHALHSKRLKAILAAHKPEIDRLRASYGAGQKKPASRSSIAAAARRAAVRKDVAARQEELKERRKVAQVGVALEAKEGAALASSRRVIPSQKVLKAGDRKSMRELSKRIRAEAAASGIAIAKTAVLESLRAAAADKKAAMAKSAREEAKPPRKEQKPVRILKKEVAVINTPGDDERRERREQRAAAARKREEQDAAALRPVLACFINLGTPKDTGTEDSRMARLSDLLDQNPEDRVLAQELAKLLRLASNPTEAAKVLWGRETFPRIYTADDLQRDIDRKIRLGEFLEISTCLRAGRKPLAAATLLETVVAEFPESEEARLQLGLIRRPGEFTIEGSGDKKKIALGHRKSVETLLPLIASPTHGEMAVASIVESKLALEDTQSALRWAEFRRPSPEDEPLGRLLTVAKFAHGLKTADIDLVEEALAHLPQHILKVGKKGIHLDFSPVVTTAQGLRADFRIAEYGFSPVVRLAEALLRCQRNEEAFLLFRDGDLLAKKDEKEPDADSRTDRLRGYLAGGISYLRKIDSSKRVAELQEHSGDSAAANRKLWDRGYRQAFCYLLQAYRVDRNHVELNAALRHVMAVTQNPAMARALKLEQDRQSKQADELLEQVRLGQEKAAEPVVVDVEGNRLREQAERRPHRPVSTGRQRTSVPAMVS